MDIIKQIIKTLELVEVRGSDNLDRLLACIQKLKQLDQALDNELKKEQKNDDQDKQAQDVPGAVD